jgi:RimJ/RimL family protein N-acetyltransferase
MRCVIATHKEQLAEWTRARIPGVDSLGSEYQAIGLVDADRIWAAVVYTDYSGFNICMHVASEGKQWMTRGFLFAVFDYPFNQLRVDRVTAFVASRNKASRHFCERIGFQVEGRLREAHHGDDLIAYGMLKRECRWIEHGKAKRARCA